MCLLSTLKTPVLMKERLMQICSLYADGFRNMTIGKTLWALILIKLFIMFCILRVFFFPNYLNNVADNDAQKEDFVSQQLILRGNAPDTQ